MNNEDEISSKKNLQKYKLGTSVNVVRIKEALVFQYYNFTRRHQGIDNKIPNELYELKTKMEVAA